jgi:gliding motility-associated-like protein
LKLLLKFSFFCLLILHSSEILSQEPTDCINAVIACGNADITLDVNGIGTQELGFGQNCSSQENNSIWLSVTAVTAGTLGFTLSPNSRSLSEDYDFFVFGPNVACGNLGQAIRCSTTNPQNAGLSYNTTGMNGTETDTSEGPGASGNSFVSWLDVNAGETYFIVIDRPIGNSPFSLEWTGTATFSEPPTNESTTSGTALNIDSCDEVAPFTDETTRFMLSDNTASIVGSQTNVTVTYHVSASDANIGTNALTSPYTNISNPQTIYVRITNVATGCFELTDFQLSVSGPDFTTPSDFILCDNLDDGNDKNGQVLFDLASKNAEIFNGQNLADFNVSYYTTMADAENRTNALPYSYYNTTPFNEQLFVRIEETSNQLCSSFTTLNLQVNEAPEAFDTSLLQCDEDGLSDGLTIFNLNQAKDELTGAVANRALKFYTDIARTIEVNGDAFNNTSNPQIIYVEVINNTTGCSGYSQLTLGVTVTDSNNAYLTFCDDDGLEDGLYNFNLNDATADILAGLPPNLDVVYYQTFNDAVLEQNPLNPIYTNTIPYYQIVYARVENANDCYGISQVFLYVFALPEIKTEDLFYYCLNSFPETITIDAALLSGNQNNYSYTWSNGANTYATQINQPGVYTVTVTDGYNCYKQRTVTIEASNTATFNSPAFNVNDVSQNNTITVYVSGEGIYEFSLIDENGNTIQDYQDSNVFTNVFPGIYTVLVKDIKNDCGVSENKVSVIGFPKFFTPNNDGINDEWKIYGVSSMFQPNTKIKIYDRYGKLIKQLNPLSEGWNGYFNGKKLPSDDYWFSVILQDGRLFKNHFTLKN